VICLALLAACGNKEEKSPVNAAPAVQAQPVAPAVSNKAPEKNMAAAGGMPTLARKYNCTACHAIDKKELGPALKAVAAKYKGDAGAAARLSEKIKKGGAGVWGSIPMPANPKVSDADMKEIVTFILAL